MTGIILSHTCRQELQTRPKTRIHVHTMLEYARARVRVRVCAYICIRSAVETARVLFSLSLLFPRTLQFRASLRNLDSSFRSRYGLCFQLTRGGTPPKVGSTSRELKRPPQPCRRRDVNFGVSRLFRLSALARIKSRIQTAYCSLCYIFYLLETLRTHRLEAVPN